MFAKRMAVAACALGQGGHQYQKNVGLKQSGTERGDEQGLLFPALLLSFKDNMPLISQVTVDTGILGNGLFHAPNYGTLCPDILQNADNYLGI